MLAMAAAVSSLLAPLPKGGWSFDGAAGVIWRGNLRPVRDGAAQETGWG